MKEFIKKMPKVELHAHLNGSLNEKALLELGAIVHGETTEEFHRLCESFKLNENLSLQECFKKFKIAHDLTATKDGLTWATLLVVRDFAQDNVVYLELRTTPRATVHVSKKEYVQTVLDAIRLAKTSYPSICVNLLLSIDRSKGKEDAKNTFEVVIHFLTTDSDIIKGIDLSGNPLNGSFNEYREILNEARKYHLNLALHCAEVENNEETNAMLTFGMERCGHGTFLSSENLAIVKHKRIPIECCLTSNVKCGTVLSFKDHHFYELFLSHHPVVLCTDDTGVFDTTLSNEISIAQETFLLSKEDIRKLSLTAVDASFANEIGKHDLKKTIDDYFGKEDFAQSV